MFVWVHLYPCILIISCPKTAGFLLWRSISEYEKTHNDEKFSKKVKMIIFDDKLIHSVSYQVLNKEHQKQDK